MVHEATASEATLTSLDYPTILQLLEERCRTPYGKERARDLRPSSAIQEVLERQVSTRDWVGQRQRRGNLALSLATDIRPHLERMAVEGSNLGGAELFLIVEQLKAALTVRETLLGSEQRSIEETGRRFPDLRNLIRFLDGKISPAGRLEDRCSSDLLKIRRWIASLSQRLETQLRAIASKAELSRVLQDDFIALRNNRHVLPVRIDAQGMIEGIVHALSSSGATVYMEPLSTVPLNNELVRLKEQEEMEVQRLLAEFSDLLRSRLGELHALVETLGEVDLAHARAVLAEEMAGVDPEFSDGSTGSALLRLSGARHPLLERALRATGERVVPLDVVLDREHPVLVISGPNTGGKTVALKTLGLFSLMAQSGLKLPALEAKLPLFAKVLIDIGDHQSISDSLSTFSARMANISAMTRQIAGPALVLLDEVGSGTDPEEGGALGASIIDYFRRCGALVLATTHHQGIKAYAAQTPGVANGSMEFDEATLRPLYRMRAGVPGRSGGLDMAQRVGLPAEIVRQAREMLPRQREIMDGYLHALQALQEAWSARVREAEESARRSQEREAQQRESESAAARDREARFARALQEVADTARRAWEEAGRGILEGERERRVRAEMRRKEGELIDAARRALDPDLLPARLTPASGAAGAIEPGRKMRIRSLGLEGVVERIDQERVLLRCGTKQVQARREDLEALGDAAAAGPALPAGVHLTRTSAPELRREINLTGRRVDEALPLLDKFLDDASLGSLSPLRVIHGLGSGRLRTAIRGFLETHPLVEGFADAEERDGGRGATVVRLRI